jgi:hypothetical protein
VCESFGTWGQKSIVLSTRPPGDFPGMNTVTPTSAIAHTYLPTYLPILLGTFPRMNVVQASNSPYLFTYLPILMRDYFRKFHYLRT